MVCFFNVACGLVTACLFFCGMSAGYAEEEAVPAVAAGVNRDIQEREQNLKEKVFAKFAVELRALKKNCAEANDVETEERLRTMSASKQFPKENTLVIPFEFFHGEWQEHSLNGEGALLRFDGRSVKSASGQDPKQWRDCGRVVSAGSSADVMIVDGKQSMVCFKWADDEMIRILADGKVSRFSRFGEWQSPVRQFARLVKKMRSMYRKGKRGLRVSQIADLKKKQEVWKKDHQYAAAVWAEKKIKAFSSYVSASEKNAEIEGSTDEGEELMNDVALVGTWTFPEGRLIVNDISAFRFADQKGKEAMLEHVASSDSSCRLYRVKETGTRLFEKQADYAVVCVGKTLYLVPTAKNALRAFVGVATDDFFDDESNGAAGNTADDTKGESSEIKKLEDEFGDP